jgi:hypothetical protein
MKKALSRVLFAVIAVVALALPAFADTAPTYAMPNIGTQFGTALQSLWANVIDIIALVLPAGLAIMGISIAVGLGRKFIRMFAK